MPHNGDESKMMKKLFVVMLAMAAMSMGCDDKKKKEEAGGGDGALPQACQDYLKKQEACIGKVPDAAKEGMKTALKTTKDSFKAANTPEARKALEGGCKASLATLAKNPMCK